MLSAIKILGIIMLLNFSCTSSLKNSIQCRTLLSACSEADTILCTSWILFHWPSQQSYKVGRIHMPILQMRKRRHRELQLPCSGHTALNYWGPGSNSGGIQTQHLWAEAKDAVSQARLGHVSQLRGMDVAGWPPLRTQSSRPLSSSSISRSAESRINYKDHRIRFFFSQTFYVLYLNTDYKKNQGIKVIEISQGFLENEIGEHPPGETQPDKVTVKESKANSLGESEKMRPNIQPNQVVFICILKWLSNAFISLV